MKFAINIPAKSNNFLLFAGEGGVAPLLTQQLGEGSLLRSTKAKESGNSGISDLNDNLLASDKQTSSYAQENAKNSAHEVPRVRQRKTAASTLFET